MRNRFFAGINKLYSVKEKFNANKVSVRAVYDCLAELYRSDKAEERLDVLILFEQLGKNQFKYHPAWYNWRGINYVVLLTDNHDGSNKEKYFLEQFSPFKTFTKIPYHPAGDKVVRLTTSAKEIFNMLLDNGLFGGFVIDPEDNPVFLSRDGICTTSNIQDPRRSQVNWGKGIPKYDPAQLMSGYELADFAIKDVLMGNVLKNEGYRIVSHNAGLGPKAYPQIIAEKDGQTFFVLVEVGLFPNKPKLDIKNLDLSSVDMNYVRQHNVKLLFAGVSFASLDEKRAEKQICLVGDAYRVSYLNIEGIKIKDNLN